MKRKIITSIKIFVIVLAGYLVLTSTFISASTLPLPITTISKTSINTKAKNILEKMGVQEQIETTVKSKYFKPISDQIPEQRQPIWPTWEVTTQNYLLVFQGQTGNLLRFERKLNFEDNKEQYSELSKTPELGEKEAVETAEALMKILHPDADYQYISFNSVKPQHETYVKYSFKYKYEFPWTLIGFLSRDGAKDFKYYFYLEIASNGQIIQSWLTRVPLSSTG